MIKYIGSKRLLVGQILQVVEGFAEVRRVADLFSGTARIGHALKRAGYQVVSNDHNAYAHALARCYVAADRDHVGKEAERLITELQALAPQPGYFTETFCEKSRFFHPKNGARIDAIREAIAQKGLEPDLEAVLLVALMEAADRVDSTTGVQMAYLKQWAPRASNDLQLRMPDVLAGRGVAWQLDALEAAQTLSEQDVDLVYLDPPYNQHSYLGNYHVWESLVRWDKPEVYGIACKRVDCRTTKSRFNSKVQLYEALKEIIAVLRAKHLVVSFNNEGYVSRDDMERLLGDYGQVRVVETDFKRYVGAQIGIYNPKGEKVGNVSHLRNKEYLFVVSKHAASARKRTHRPPVTPTSKQA